MLKMLLCPACGYEEVVEVKKRGRPRRLCSICRRERRLEQKRKANKAYYDRKKGRVDKKKPNEVH